MTSMNSTSYLPLHYLDVYVESSKARIDKAHIKALNTLYNTEYTDALTVCGETSTHKGKVSDTKTVFR